MLPCRWPVPRARIARDAFGEAAGWQRDFALAAPARAEDEFDRDVTRLRRGIVRGSPRIVSSVRRIRARQHANAQQSDDKSSHRKFAVPAPHWRPYSSRPTFSRQSLLLKIRGFNPSSISTAAAANIATAIGRSKKMP